MISIQNKKEGIIIQRFGSKLNYSIRGGFQKLLSFIIKQYHPSKIISFCDLRYATGKSYVNAGFILENISLGWNWTDYKKRYNRLACRAGEGKSELEHAKELGWSKIYDAGQARYVLTINQDKLSTYLA